MNEVQKNFRRQMNEIEKQNGRKKVDGVSQPPFYSYIKRDVIKSYYEKNKTKKRVIQGLSLISIIFILWNSYAILTWVKPIIRGITNKDIPIVSMVLDSRGVKQRETAEYLTNINDANIPIHKFGSDKVTAISGIPTNLINYREKKIEILQELQMNIQRAASTIQQTKVPVFLKNYHALDIQLANYAIQICSQLILAEQSLDKITYNKHIGLNNEAVLLYNQTAMQLQKELINVFEDISMEYEITATGVTFHYKQ